MTKTQPTMSTSLQKVSIRLRMIKLFSFNNTIGLWRALLGDGSIWKMAGQITRISCRWQTPRDALQHGERATCTLSVTNLRSSSMRQQMKKRASYSRKGIPTHSMHISFFFRQRMTVSHPVKTSWTEITRLCRPTPTWIRSCFTSSFWKKETARTTMLRVETRQFQLSQLHLTPTCIWRLCWSEPVWVLSRFLATEK